MKVGDYVRYKYEDCIYIGKIKFISEVMGFEETLQLDIDTCMEEILKEDIIKSSPNIIDLIEVGDYVNEQLVMEIYEKNSIYKGSLNYKFKERTLELFNTDYECIPHEFLINNKRIERILTKEQFSSMEYKVN